MTRIITFFLVLFVNLCWAQDIVYFDKKGKTTSQNEAYYYRKKETDNHYKSTYVNGGSTYFEGDITKASATDEGQNKYTGKCTWYYKDGVIKATRTFNDEGQEDGQSTHYYESGKVWKEIEYVKGSIKNNRFVEYSEDGKKSRILEESFVNNNNDWDLYRSDKSSAKMLGGKLELESYAKEGTARYISASVSNDDILIEANIDMSIAAKGQKAGIIFGFKDWDNYNYFLISESGMSVGYVFEGISAEKVENMFAPSYKSKEKNSIKLLASDDKMIFSINGEVQYSCARFNNVGTKLGIALSGIGKITVDNLILKEFNYVAGGGGNSNSVSKSDYDIKATGSGILVSENGYIITNEHVIDGANKIIVEITNEGITKSYNATLVQKDKDNDLAVLKINDDLFKPLPELKYTFKESGAVDVGASVFTIGFPLALSGMGKEAKYTDGKISSKTGYNGALNTYQTSIPVQPGNSGGPVFNNNGELIGVINASVKETDNVSYTIKLNYIKNIIEAIGEIAKMPNNKSIESLSTEEKIKVLSNYVTLIKIK